MTDFKGGQTVYDANGKSFEYHHTFSGVHYCYPLIEIQDAEGNWYDHPGEQLVGMATIYAYPPVTKIAGVVLELSQKIDDLKVQEKEAKAAAYAARSERDAAERMLREYRERHHFMLLIGKMLDGEHLHFIVVPNHEWTIPEPLGPRDVTAAKIMWDAREKRFFFAKKRSGAFNGDDVLEAFETQEELLAFIQMMFAKLCDRVRRDASSEKGGNPYDPARDYTTPHIKALRKWVAKWPHLEVPQDILDGEKAFLDHRKRKQIESAAQRLKELQDDGG